VNALIKAMDHTDAVTLADLQDAYAEAIEVLVSENADEVMRDYALRLLALIELPDMGSIARAA